MRTVERSLRKRRRTEAVLVGHHDQLVPRGPATLPGRDDPGHQRQLLVAVDLLVGRLFDKAAVAIDEEDLAVHAGVPARNTASTRSVSLPVPMVVRDAASRP